MEDPRAVLEDLDEGFEKLEKVDKKRFGAFWNFLETTFEPEYVDEKTKELIIVAIAVCSGCIYCITRHVRDALKAGASREEIVQVGWIASVMCGGAAPAYMATYLMKCLDTFGPDVGK